MCKNTFAQQTEEDNVAFIYAKGERTDGKLKVIIIGTHIMGFKGLNKPLNDDVETKFSLGFSQLINDIKYAESVPGLADYHNIHFESPEIVSISSYIHPSIRQKYNIHTQDLKITAIEKIRKGLMDEYSSKGYKIYQISFDPTEYNEFKYYNGSDWIPYQYVKRSAISTLWIPYYRKGEIKSMVAALGGFDKKNTYGNTGEKTPVKSSSLENAADEERFKQQARINQYMAEQLQAEADRLYNSGFLFYGDALQKYKEAYRLSPTTHSAQRIEYIESMYALGEGINKLGESVDNAVYNLDPEEKTLFAYSYINYTGLPLYYSNQFINSSVMTAAWGLSMHRLFISIDLRMGYQTSPLYEYNLNKINKYDTYQSKIPANETVQVQQSSLGMGGGIGINVPVKKVLFYGLYGGDFMFFTLKSFVRSENFDFKGLENPNFPFSNRKFTVGTIINIPKTKIALGGQFNWNKIKGETESTPYQINKISDPETRFYLGTTTNPEYKYQNFGFSFLWKI